MSKTCWPEAGRRARTALALLVASLLLAAAGCSTLSVDEERQLGAEMQRQARSELVFLHDRVVDDYVEQIGRRIIAAAGPQPFAYHFYVVESDELNAFAMPAGHVYIHTAILLQARNVSELAGVIGHEIGHVALRHIAENYGKQKGTGMARSALVLAGGLLAGQGGAFATNLVTGVGAMAVVNTFTREAEREADAFAVEVLPKAGYDPHGIVTFFDTLSREADAGPPEFLSSHPAPQSRIEATRAQIAAESLPPGLRVDDGGRFEIIQRRVQLLTGQAEPVTGGGR